MQLEAHRRDDAKVAAAAQRPEQLLFILVVGDDDASVREDDLCGLEIVEGEPEPADQRAIAAAKRDSGYSTAATEPVTGARPSGSVAAATSAARAPPETVAVPLDATATFLIPLTSMTTPSHNARPAQSWPPPRTESERSPSRAVRMADSTSSAVRQWTTARGICPTGFDQMAVVAA
jgi:hypothetical protein